MNRLAKLYKPLFAWVSKELYKQDTSFSILRPEDSLLDLSLRAVIQVNICGRWKLPGALCIADNRCRLHSGNSGVPERKVIILVAPRRRSHAFRFTLTTGYTTCLQIIKHSRHRKIVQNVLYIFTQLTHPIHRLSQCCVTLKRGLSYPDPILSDRNRWSLLACYS